MLHTKAGVRRHMIQSQPRLNHSLYKQLYSTKIQVKIYYKRINNSSHIFFPMICPCLIIYSWLLRCKLNTLVYSLQHIFEYSYISKITEHLQVATGKTSTIVPFIDESISCCYQEVFSYF
ncbi:hypothetical protein L873DRAFT_1040894 [Choiromyces venosus 120613-1]|uniref:Uncharacterized protein n=1 Tax=Choiromyces venosus 120613-1 TaxID=1336337 RepID=A0A3N4JXF8_9PEZI|nr:hypothetical protein L873DRAFT_1040894 [Choiromyces venosus 120613-1]